MNDQPRITFLGQSGFLLETSDFTLLIDPTNKKSGDYSGDLVYCTHEHMDHVGGVEVFMERNPQAILLGSENVTKKFSIYGDRTVTCEDGGTFEKSQWHLEFKRLRHGFFKGVINLGIVVTLGEFGFAHCGDAVSFDGFPTSPVNVLAVPIGGGFAAGPRKALNFIQQLSEPLPTIVPMHWVFRNPRGFCKKVTETVPNANCIVPTKGEPLKGFD